MTSRKENSFLSLIAKVLHKELCAKHTSGSEIEEDYRELNSIPPLEVNIGKKRGKL